MNLPNQIRGLHKVGLSVDEIANVLSDAIVGSYRRHYFAEGRVTSYFKLIGIYNSQKWKNLLENNLESTVRTQLYENLKLVQCVEDAINQTSSNSNEFTKLVCIVNSDKFVRSKVLNSAFCKAFLQLDLDEIEYTDYNLSEFVLDTQLTKRDIQKIIRYVVNACFFATEHKSFIDVWLYPIRNSSIDTNIVKEELNYAETMLKKCNNLTSVNIGLLSYCLCGIIEILPAEHQGDVLDETLALSRFIPTNLQTSFLGKVFDCVKRNSHISLAKFIKLIAMCLNEGVGTAKDLYKFLTAILFIKANDEVLLKEIVKLDNKSLKQLQEIGVLLETFNMI